MTRTAWWGLAVCLAFGAAGAGCESSTTQSPPVLAQGKPFTKDV
jgi:hypothetical protein